MTNNTNEKFSLLKNSITSALEKSCETAPSMISKVIEAVGEIELTSTEPGVELVDSLKTIVRTAITHALKHDCDVSIIIKGIIMGAFRSSDAVRQEAHKTIDHLVRLILTECVGAGADARTTTAAIIEGILEVAKSEKLNLEEALSEAGTSAVLASFDIEGGIEPAVREALSKDFQGHAVELKEEFLSKESESGDTYRNPN